MKNDKNINSKNPKPKIPQITKSPIAPRLYEKTLDESSHYRLICVYETTFLINKMDGEKRMLCQHYGDPASGIISPNQSWVVCEGQGIELHCIESAVSREYLAGANIHDMRLESPTSIQILVDL